MFQVSLAGLNFSVLQFTINDQSSKGIIKAVFDGKKPYNPILGETCSWIFDHKCEKGGVSKMICEQVISNLAVDCKRTDDS